MQQRKKKEEKLQKMQHWAISFHPQRRVNNKSYHSSHFQNNTRSSGVSMEITILLHFVYSNNNNISFWKGIPTKKRNYKGNLLKKSTKFKQLWKNVNICSLKRNLFPHSSFNYTNFNLKSLQQ